jgi:uncharacterized protein (DUF362 family)
MSEDRITRREFMKRAVALGVAAYGLSGRDGLLDSESLAEAAGKPTIVVSAKSHDPAALARAAIDGLGGMRRFVKKGNVVVVKPNIGWNRKPEHAANTNPQVVAEIVRLCKQAGAREVKVLDHPVDQPESAVMRASGIAEAAEKAGGRVLPASSRAMYGSVRLRRGKALRSAEVLKDITRADVFINLPIAKVHGATGVTLGCKNLMGAVWDRGAWHDSASLDQCIADFASEVRPDLIVLDAVRVLLTNGPKGPGRTKDLFTIVAGTDAVAVDAYGATLLSRKPEQIGHLRLAAEMGIGEIDLKRVTIKHV